MDTGIHRCLRMAQHPGQGLLARLHATQEEAAQEHSH